MKRLGCILLFLFLTSAGMQAWGKPFLQDGKKWNYFWNAYKPFSYYYSFFLSGDTIVGNRSCKKLYRQVEGEDASLYAVLFENVNGVVSTVRADGSLELLYDFSMKVGSKVSKRTSYFDYDYTVIKKDTIKSCGRQYKRLVLEADFNPARHVVWTEKIGGDMYSIVHNGLEILQGDYSILLNCEVDGETIYCTHEYKSPLLADGKVWTYRRGSASAGYEYMRQTVEGDTLIGTQTWKKVFVESPLGTGMRYEKAMREDSLKVFELADDGQEKLFLDFGARYYEQFPIDDSGSACAEVIPTFQGPPTYCGVERQQVILALKKDGIGYAYSYWTEAIGGCGIYKPFTWNDDDSPDWELFTCYESGECIYRLTGDESQDPYELTVEEVRQPTGTAGGTYTLSGQRVASPRKGIYVRDGKKVLLP